jgi:hypothetical protein
MERSRCHPEVRSGRRGESPDPVGDGEPVLLVRVRVGRQAAVAQAGTDHHELLRLRADAPVQVPAGGGGAKT